MELWQQMIRESLHASEDIVKKFNFPISKTKELNSFFQARINPYYLSLIRTPGDPIWKQCIPDPVELEDYDAFDDPLNEDGMSPTPNITHRYPDRALFLVSSQCGMYCRFCTRKRKVGNSDKISMKYLESAFQYLEEHKEVRDVILSGGDPLMLTDYMLEKILIRLRSIPHLEIIRLGTKMPCVLPQRITPKLCNMLKKYHPIYVNTHFNHPWEITPEASKACQMLADCGCPVGNQTVLMKGVNDSPAIIKELMQKLLRIRVKPYYLYMADETKGANHFRTSIRTGIEIMDALRGHTSGLAVPYFVIDAPGGGGKIPILPEYVLHHDKDKIVLRNFKNEIFVYREKKSGEESMKKLRNTGNGKTKIRKQSVEKIEIPELQIIEN